MLENNRGGGLRGRDQRGTRRIGGFPLVLRCLGVLAGLVAALNVITGLQQKYRSGAVLDYNKDLYHRMQASGDGDLKTALLAFLLGLAFWFAASVLVRIESLSARPDSKPNL